MNTIDIIDDPTKPIERQNIIRLKPWLSLDEMQAYYRDWGAWRKERDGFYTNGELDIFIFRHMVASWAGPWLSQFEHVLQFPYNKRFIQRAIEQASAIFSAEPDEPEQPDPN